MDAGVLKDIVVLGVAVILQLLPVEHELLGGDGKALVLVDLLLDLEDGIEEADLDGEVLPIGGLEEDIHG